MTLLSKFIDKQLLIGSVQSPHFWTIANLLLDFSMDMWNFILVCTCNADSFSVLMNADSFSALQGVFLYVFIFVVHCFLLYVVFSCMFFVCCHFGLVFESCYCLKNFTIIISLHSVYQFGVCVHDISLCASYVVLVWLVCVLDNQAAMLIQFASFLCA